MAAFPAAGAVRFCVGKAHRATSPLIEGSEHPACAPGSTELCFQSAPDLLQRMLPHFQAQAKQVRDPNHREMFNTLLARAQAA